MWTFSAYDIADRLSKKTLHWMHQALFKKWYTPKSNIPLVAKQ